MVIARLSGTDGLDDAADAAIRGGALALEVTLNTPGALPWLERAAARYGEDILLGAGTVRTAGQVRDAVSAGARLIVSPGTVPTVVAATKDAGAAAMPGCYTATEIEAAVAAGADLVKLFPAGISGPQYVADLTAALDDVQLVVTGRVTAEDAGAYVSAGATAVGIGTWALSDKLINEGRWDVIEGRVRQTCQQIAGARPVPPPVVS
ncbi:bifunctional 4-hydroxy-2-oxoglutarate aldolase/2-dehydro-3-deoxy-phosphogluconate aldolase [Jiangella asiatica]|uniref:bifunctional 4-hydroxy-2-oxoglutarate aldolase/2-dehydro-3-deoxy-phosphogluconate aldolase n=1 Tax=Jiangella asiatica TaxID=2530372 RepID=UPI0013A5E2E8|nr:bifunctional 4-hydroxy-2-oxoglutarate aldolase/2-dehydro-3-deoxy-phosphogluconate aldolase [Jiangella asiatica]